MPSTRRITSVKGKHTPDSHPIYAEMRRRSVRVTKADVIEVTRTRLQKPTLGAPGSMTVFLAAKSSAAMDEVRAAVNEGGLPAKKLSEHVSRQYKRRRQQTVKEAVKAISRARVFAELRYGGATLATGLFLPKGLDVAVLCFPYNGGRLTRDGFTLVEYIDRHATDAGIDVLVIKVDPDLSDVEEGLLEAQNDADRFQNVGYEAWCDTTAWAVAAGVVAAATLAAAVATLGCVAPNVEVPHLSERDVQRLGPEASVQKLLNIRRDALYAMVGLQPRG